MTSPPPPMGRSNPISNSPRSQGKPASVTKTPGDGVDDLELATLNSVWWFNEIRLDGQTGHIPPTEYEANHYRHSIVVTLSPSQRI